MLPPNFVPQQKCVFPKHAHTSNTDCDKDWCTKMCEKDANKIVCLMHVIKMYLHRIAMALFLKMINIWWFDTWTWPSGIAVGACLRLNLTCFLLWIHHYNSWHECITIYTVNSNSNMGQISHNVPITSELQSLLCNPHYRPPLINTI